MTGVARCGERDELGGKSDGVEDGADKQPLEAVGEKMRFLKSDIAPLAAPHLEKNEQHDDAEYFIDEALREDCFVCAQEEYFRCVNGKADDEDYHRVSDPVFLKIHKSLLRFSFCNHYTCERKRRL